MNLTANSSRSAIRRTGIPVISYFSFCFIFVMKSIKARGSQVINKRLCCLVRASVRRVKRRDLKQIFKYLCVHEIKLRLMTELTVEG
jgi:hypothetical protein